MQEMTRDFKDEIELGINDLEKKNKRLVTKCTGG